MTSDDRCDSAAYSSDFKVIFEFPPKSESDEEIEMEIKNIMAGAMKEHLTRPSQSHYREKNSR